jgi:predicted transcriptional regulator
VLSPPEGLNPLTGQTDFPSGTDNEAISVLPETSSIFGHESDDRVHVDDDVTSTNVRNTIRSEAEVSLTALSMEMERGEPRLTSKQASILQAILDSDQFIHAYGLAKAINMHEETVRSGLIALDHKGLIERLAATTADSGRHRQMYRVADRANAERALRKDREKRAREIQRLNDRLQSLMAAVR